MAKLGPFCKRDNCSVVRGVLDRLKTHFLVQSMVVHVSLELEGGWSLVLEGAVGAGSAVVEVVGAMGVPGTAGLLLAEEEVSEKNGWHI